MRKFAITFIVGSLLLGQSALGQLTSVDPNNPITKLNALKAENEKLLKRQAELINRLIELEAKSDQLRIFSKRS